MKKIIALLLLCGGTCLQAITIKNDSNVTVKFTISGLAIAKGQTAGVNYYVLKPGSNEVKVPIAKSDSYIDYIKVDRFFDFSEIKSVEELQAVLNKVCGANAAYVTTDKFFDGSGVTNLGDLQALLGKLCGVKIERIGAGCATSNMADCAVGVVAGQMDLKRRTSADRIENSDTWIFKKVPGLIRNVKK